jgi:protein KRI1
MAGTKEKTRTNGVKRELNATNEPPTKKAKLLDNTDDEGSDSDNGRVSLKVNEEYARKYEHNKKQAEKFRCTRVFSVEPLSGTNSKQ